MKISGKVRRRFPVTTGTVAITVVVTDKRHVYEIEDFNGKECVGFVMTLDGAEKLDRNTVLSCCNYETNDGTPYR